MRCRHTITHDKNADAVDLVGGVDLGEEGLGLGNEGTTEEKECELDMARVSHFIKLSSGVVGTSLAGTLSGAGRLAPVQVDLGEEGLGVGNEGTTEEKECELDMAKSFHFKQFSSTKNIGTYLLRSPKPAKAIEGQGKVDLNAAQRRKTGASTGME